LYRPFKEGSKRAEAAESRRRRVEEAAPFIARERRKLVRQQAIRIENVGHADTPHSEGIRQEKAVALLIVRLRTHQSCRFLSPKCQEPPQASRELRRSHVVREAPEGIVAPTQVA